ncbi:hypothetical protein F2P56_014205 [Juglans regia]|uniref:RING-type E3 ubiquitin transferase n=2 Tax=Juglans regia TaxID=51240 RepID=A0A833XCW6_JUGRE|nr:E3 ubiquitin-protein ligase ATL6-like [Juglans regia]KAF5464096.1 hypothetical protein F2P56_014204 [Juglans regia]KAF5464097.1 hypothetical protein F2P56_014205 [Juglans regia]
MEDCYGILRLYLLLIAPAYLQYAYAQPTAESTDSPFRFDLDLTPSTLIITVVLVCGFALLAFFSIYIKQCTRSRAAAASRTVRPDVSSTPDRPKRRGLDPAVVETFPILAYSAVKGLKIGRGALECAVCLNEFEDHETLRLLPKCNHVFHPYCIDTWLTSWGTCPVCRARLTPEASKADPSQANESTPENSTSQVGEDQNHVVVNVEEVESGGLQQAREIANLPVRQRIPEKFQESNSTGESVVQPGENTERYTLRLPEEVRKQVLECEQPEIPKSHGVVLTRVESSRKGYRTGGGREE